MVVVVIPPVRPAMKRLVAVTTMFFRTLESTVFNRNPLIYMTLVRAICVVDLVFGGRCADIERLSCFHEERAARGGAMDEKLRHPPPSFLAFFALILVHLVYDYILQTQHLCLAG